MSYLFEQNNKIIQVIIDFGKSEFSNATKKIQSNRRFKKGI